VAEVVAFGARMTWPWRCSRGCGCRCVAQRAPRECLRGFVLGELAIDFVSHEVRVGDVTVRLTTTEYRILGELARNAGLTMPHHLLPEPFWGSEWVGDPSHLKVFIRRLRRKRGDAAEAPRFIETVWGTGNRLLAPH
jgi:DNA-binding response OmpR family regulator